MSTTIPQRAERLLTIFQTQLSPSHLELLDESHMHAGSVLETHFRAVIVSSQFEGVTRVKRHQMVYSLVADELAQELHALALHLYTSLEWERQGEVPASPHCHGGEKPL